MNISSNYMDVTQLRVAKPGCLPVCCLLSAKCWIHYLTVIFVNRAPFYSLFWLFFNYFWMFFLHIPIQYTNVPYYTVLYLLAVTYMFPLSCCAIYSIVVCRFLGDQLFWKIHFLPSPIKWNWMIVANSTTMSLSSIHVLVTQGGLSLVIALWEAVTAFGYYIFPLSVS